VDATGYEITLVSDDTNIT
jgi:hypothetical protein